MKYGGIKRINKSKGFFNYEKRYLTTTDPETNLETKACTFTRRMSNYFSFGVDSRIGYGRAYLCEKGYNIDRF